MESGNTLFVKTDYRKEKGSRLAHYEMSEYSYTICMTQCILYICEDISARNNNIPAISSHVAHLLNNSGLLVPSAGLESTHTWI